MMTTCCNKSSLETPEEDPYTVENPQQYGHYKDVFMDAGVALSHFNLTGLKVFEYGNFTAEYVNTESKDIQAKYFISTEDDANGVLLYPDGAPRFRMIYVNGGLAGNHGSSMQEQGRENIRTFFRNGGSFAGSCAGGFLAGKGFYDKTTADTVRQERSQYLHLYDCCPMDNAGTNGYFDMVLEAGNNPLLSYYDFPEDLVIPKVRHANGPYLREGYLPEQIEILARFNSPYKKIMQDKPCVWAWKDTNDVKAGRIVCSSSHPEYDGIHKQDDTWKESHTQLITAIYKYAMDGNGMPQIKGTLEAGKSREMTATTGDNNPGFTRIGDLQYHHFLLDVPESCQKATVTLIKGEGFEDVDMQLFAERTGLAFNGFAAYSGTAILEIASPKAGKWFVSAFCATTVGTEEKEYGFEYTGALKVLNGIPYTISVSYE